MWFLILIIICCVVGWIVNLINDAKERRREAIREIVAEEILKPNNIEVKIRIYNEKIKKFNNFKIDKTKERNEIDSFARTVFGNKLLGNCPKCKKGYLTVRKGRFGKFVGCSSYPNCKYVTNVKVAKAKYRESVSAQIMEEIHKVYS